VRRGTAWPPAEQPSSRLAVQRKQSHTLAGDITHSRAVMLAQRRVCPHSTTFGVPTASPCQDVRDVHPCPGRPVHFLRQRPGGQRPTRPASGVRCVPADRPSGVQCPVSARPLSGASVRYLCNRVRIHVVRTGEFLECLSCQPDQGQASWAVTHQVRGGSPAARVQACHWELAQAALGSARRRPGARPSSKTRGRRLGSTAWPAGSSRLREDRPSGGERVQVRLAHLQQAGWSSAQNVLSACGRPDLGPGSPAPGGPWPDRGERARSRRGPRQLAGPSEAGKPGGDIRSDLGE
jgi:hypothetical protein